MGLRESTVSERPKSCIRLFSVSTVSVMSFGRRFTAVGRWSRNRSIRRPDTVEDLSNRWILDSSTLSIPQRDTPYVARLSAR